MNPLSLLLIGGTAYVAYQNYQNGLIGTMPEVPMGSLDVPNPTVLEDGNFSNMDQSGTPVDTSTINTDPTITPEQKLAAFLYMIRSSEHIFPRDVTSGDDYFIFYSGTRFTDSSDHPVLTGEMQGVPLPPEVCINAGFANGVCVSTAAGAYQITVPTWREIRNYNGPEIPDFSPDSQDEAARRILEKIGALPLIYSGDLARAITIAGQRWASLPGARAKQNQRSADFVIARYNEGLALA